MSGSSLGSPGCPPPVHSPSEDLPPGPLAQAPPHWAVQAGRGLAEAEAELRRLRERHAAETESVKRGVERAVLGARREERRLLERVEQDHRDAQQRLEQVHRENMAAARVSQSLLDRRLGKLTQLQKQVEDLGQSVLAGGGPTHHPLLKDVAQFLQPWEISVSLKKVSFKPSPQPNAVTFGDIRVQEQNLALHVGGCGPQGQTCALHSQEMQPKDTDDQSSPRSSSPRGQGFTSPAGRVVRKISLSTRGDQESDEELKLSSAKIRRWLPRCEQSDWESCRGDETDSVSPQPQGEDVFLAVPTLLKNMDPESQSQTCKPEHRGNHFSPRSQRSRRPSPSPERRPDHANISRGSSLDRHEGHRGKPNPPNSRVTRSGDAARPSAGRTSKEPLASQSCLDLSSRGRSLSRLSQSSDEHSLGTLGDSGRAPSPADSLDSSYTFIVSPSHDRGANRAFLSSSCRLSRSAVDLTRPLIAGGTCERELWRLKCSGFSTTSSTTSPASGRRAPVTDLPQSLLHPTYRGRRTLPRPERKFTAAESKQSPVTRSFSMSVIDGDPESKTGRRERAEPALLELEEEGDASFEIFKPGLHLIGQFGKQGSGRTDLTLPSGIHATPQGQLFVVDCGNARVQVTDRRGNVLQQVASPASDGSARRCRNYFDIAVNSKGLIALSCAAERALLVFSRHGRLLQTFGGSGFGSAKDELEAPRGVTVTRLDEFLVADIRKGTLIALKLEPKTGSRLERTVVTGFHRPYLVAACLSSGMMAVSERGNETGRVPCIKVLEPGWNTLRILGVCAGMGPVLTCPWGICIDRDGNVLVADWGQHHRILLYPAQGAGWPIVNQGLSSPRGLTLLPEGQLAVSDSMHHCVKIFQYKDRQD